MNPEFVATYATHNGLTTVEAADAVLAIILKVANRHAPHFTFGYFEADDIEQEAVILALEILGAGKYDFARPLENFLFVHIRNRLCNFIRANYVRLEKPCACCNYDTPKPCVRFSDWLKRNNLRRSLMSPGDMPDQIMVENTIDHTIACHELEDRLDAGLPPQLRADYLRVRSGLRIPKQRNLVLQAAVREVLGGQ